MLNETFFKGKISSIFLFERVYEVWISAMFCMLSFIQLAFLCISFHLTPFHSGILYPLFTLLCSSISVYLLGQYAPYLFYVLIQLFSSMIEIFLTIPTKGQLISKWLCGVFDFLKKTNENRFLAEIERFSFVFWRKSKTPKTISKLTDH